MVTDASNVRATCRTPVTLGPASKAGADWIIAVDFVNRSVVPSAPEFTVA